MVIAAEAPGRHTSSSATARAVEDEGFPFEFISKAATAESWRKEINRPIYHLHKWWAQRLGSVFRGLVLGAALPAGADVAEAFASSIRLPDLTVYDPFMGSGTTVGEALKLGARAVGRDINPVCARSVRAVLEGCPVAEATAAFETLRGLVEEPLRDLYRIEVDGAKADVLYFFWVMTVNCPCCRAPVDLFNSRIFARHAYPTRYPVAHAVCPCGTVVPCRADDSAIACCSCLQTFSSQGAVMGATATCSCGRTFRILEPIDTAGGPPAYRLYAKLVLMPDGTKKYLAADARDRSAFDAATRALGDRGSVYPVVRIADGYNTRQVRRYGITHWHQFFNPRQLLALSIINGAIRHVPEGVGRELLEILFSGALEFNNMFASYKGEGTGAVRPLFSHHILKPERTPIEANVWGTPKSSGSFSGLFRSRVLRALTYAADPFELIPTKLGPTRVHGIADPVAVRAAETWQSFSSGGYRLYVSSGDSSATDIPDGGIDLVLTDPPFFDNVHYSELADFFHVWQQYVTHGRVDANTTSRSPNEVQHADAGVFAERLAGVFEEASRVLCDEGLLVFTYHHSRAEGWNALVSALSSARFVAVMTHPVKSEMSVATPKARARYPIDIDLIIVCRKTHTVPTSAVPSFQRLQRRADLQVARMRASGHAMGTGDVRVVRAGSLLPLLTRLDDREAAVTLSRATRWVDAEHHMEMGA